MRFGRRLFLYQGAVLAVLGAPATWARQALIAVPAKLRVPTLLFAPELQRAGQARPDLYVLSLESRESSVIVGFSHEKTLEFDAQKSSQAYRDNGDPVSALRARNLASWFLDHIWNSVRVRTPTEAYAALKDDFGSLQVQEVLDEVTPGAVFKLLSAIVAGRKLDRIVWHGSGFKTSWAYRAGP